MTEKDIDNAAVTRASKKTDSSEKTAAAKAKEKASGKTTAAKKPAAKKPAAAKKTSSALRLSAEEKKLIQNYRKCNSVAKMMITAAVEKAAEKYGSDKDGKEDGGNASIPGLESLMGLLGK